MQSFPRQQYKAGTLSFLFEIGFRRRMQAVKKLCQAARANYVTCEGHRSSPAVKFSAQQIRAARQLNGCCECDDAEFAAAKAFDYPQMRERTTYGKGGCIYRFV